MGSELQKTSDFQDLKDSMLYKLRLNKLDKTSRVLQKHNIIDNNGFLTIEGCQVFMDALWQKNPDIQKEIADSIEALEKEKKGKKNENK